MNDKTTREWWQLRYGDEWKEHETAWLTRMSYANAGQNNPMFGRRDQMHGLQRFVSGILGKTVEQIYGEEKGQAIRALYSNQRSGELNPAFGKVYFDGGKSVKGHYKGKFFRSLLEYSFMKHLESLGFSLENDVRYECFRIPFVFEGRNRTYHIDFHVVPEQTVYEVKPAYVMKKPPTLQLTKWEAAKVFCAEHGLQFKVVTENDFHKITFKDAYDGDNEIKWDERTFKYFKTTRNCG